MSQSKKLPDDRFLIRPDVDPKDGGAVNELAENITDWVMAQRKRVQAELAVKPASPTDTDRWEMTELRVVPLRVGGAEVTARLRSASEAAPFVVKVSEAHARALGAHLYEQVEVELRLRRGADGLIKGGEVVDVRELGAGTPGGGWRAWLKETASQWDDVDAVVWLASRGLH